MDYVHLTGVVVFVLFGFFCIAALVAVVWHEFCVWRGTKTSPPSPLRDGVDVRCFPEQEMVDEFIREKAKAKKLTR